MLVSAKCVLNRVFGLIIDYLEIICLILENFNKFCNFQLLSTFKTTFVTHSTSNSLVTFQAMCRI
jgi:hypothetical protein